MSDQENFSDNSLGNVGRPGVGKIKQKHKMQIKILKDKWKSEISKTKNPKRKEEIEQKFQKEEKYLIQKQIEELNKIGINCCNGNEKNDNIKEEDLIEQLEKNLRFYPVEREEKISKARQKKMKKQQLENEREQERLKNIIATPNYAKIETQKIEEKLKKENLKIHSVAADGHCMYRALENQLRIAEKFDKKDEKKPFDFTYTRLREIAANYIQENFNTFIPFLDHIQADSKSLEEYCNKIRGTPEWGGEVELGALSEALQRLIIVYAANNEPYKYGEIYQNDSKMPLRLSFHKHLLSLGAHYNSVIPVDYTDQL